MILSNHILFYFISQQAFMIVLNNYGRQYITERATLLPNSIFGKSYLQSTPDFQCLMDNAYITRTHSPTNYYLVHSKGIYQIQIALQQNRVESITLKEYAMMLMDICSSVCVSYNTVDLLFLGSVSSQSILFDTQMKLIADGTKTQNSVNNLQIIQSPNEAPFISLTHGYCPLPPEPYPSAGAISEVRLKLPLAFESPFSIRTQSLHRFLQTVPLPSKKLLVMSNSRNTMIYSIVNNNLSLLSQKETPLCLDAITLAVGTIASEMGDVIVQVCEKQIIVVREDALVCQVQFETAVKKACFTSQSVLFSDAANTLYSLRVTQSEPFSEIVKRLESTENPITAFYSFEAPEFTTYSRSYSLYPTGEVIDEEIRYSSKVEHVEKKQINGFVLGEDESLFTASTTHETKREETTKEVRVVEYLFVAFEDSSICVLVCLIDYVVL